MYLVWGSVCHSLHTLNLSFCFSLTNVSGLGHCWLLHTLNLSFKHCPERQVNENSIAENERFRGAGK